MFFLFFSSRRRHTRSDRDWSSDVCSSDLECPSRYQRNSAPADSGPEVRSLQESTACPSLAQDLFQKIERAWIMALTKPENCLFADSRVFVGFRDVDQQRDSLAVMNL